jgi:DNA-binding GntR family transcriptional regulator
MSPGLPNGAYEYLRGKILSGELLPQSRIKEQEVAAQLGISRTPVREALARLESEGLVQSSPRRGAVVRQVELDEIDETYEIRAALERLVAKRACERATEAEIEEMDQLLRIAEGELARGDRMAAGRHTLQFHALLNRTSRSPRLVAMLRSLDERLSAFRNQSMHQLGRAEEAMRQHRALLEALRRRDAQEMQHWVEEHAERGRLSAIKAHLEAARVRRMDG